MRHTEVILAGATLLCMAALVAAQAWPPLPVPDDTVADTYFSADTAEIRLLGVCDAISPDLSCWDTSGHTNAELVQKVANELGKNSRHGPNRPTEIPFLFRKKNRIAVFQIPVNKSTHLPTSITGFSDQMGTRLENPTYGWDPRADVRLELVNLHTDRSATSVPIDISFNLPLGNIGSVAAKVGAVSEPGNHQVTVASIEALKPGDSRVFQNNRAWMVVLKMKGDGVHSRLHLHTQLVDLKGMAIQEINSNGMPIRSPIPKPGAPMPPNMGGRHFYYPGEPGNYDPAIDGRLWQLSVNPEAVLGFQLSLSTDRTVRFKDVPLDPIR